MIGNHPPCVQSTVKPHITVYGAQWCEDTQRTCEQLDDLQIPYDHVDIDQNPKAEAWITQQNGGKRKTPTVELDGSVLFEPTNAEMEQALQEKGLL